MSREEIDELVEGPCYTVVSSFEELICFDNVSAYDLRVNNLVAYIHQAYPHHYEQILNYKVFIRFQHVYLGLGKRIAAEIYSEIKD